RLIGVELDGREQIERFYALGIQKAGMVAQSSTPDRLHLFYDWPHELGDTEPVSFRFEDERITAVVNSGYVCPPGTHPTGERKWPQFARNGQLPPEQYEQLRQAVGASRGAEKKRIRRGGKVPEGDRHAFLLSEAGRIRKQGLSEEDALAALV